MPASYIHMEMFVPTVTGHRVYVRYDTPDLIPYVYCVGPSGSGSPESGHSSMEILPVATSLARTFRWRGATKQPLSVARHSLVVRDVVERLCKLCPDDHPPERVGCHKLCGLLHDVGEMVVGDLPAPLLSTIADLRNLELSAHEAICFALLEPELGSSIRDDVLINSKVLVSYVDKMVTRWEAKNMLQFEKGLGAISSAEHLALADDETMDEYVETAYRKNNAEHLAVGAFCSAFARDISYLKEV